MTAYMDAFKSYTDSTRTYTVKRGDDTLRLTLALKPAGYFPKDTASDVKWRILHDSIGYIAVNSMMDPVADEFVEAYRHVSRLPYLIVDVRRNGGGSSVNGQKIATHLITAEQRHCVSGSWMTPEKDAYRGKLFLLTSSFTFSAAESFTIDMKESGRAILIGEPTAGDTGNNPQNFHTSRGTWFRIPIRKPALSPKGFPMEGAGIMPQHVVYQTTDDFLHDKDTQLDYALQMIVISNAR